ncbi:hypothetical protein NP493_1597g00037 [Ridgeia piscesae]|uniref:Uncharacterized protein n=1 Tax=Ridgeia piscesae TaxID=27915 RepID=A0AAD9JXL2_RIDPI|nr:hypothetical protein NP493_1597g00037 [Ridgeia piscesae]
MSPMRYFINAAINTDDIVVPLNIHHDHGYAKLSSQSCMPSSTDHVDDTSDVPVSLSPSSAVELHITYLLPTLVERTSLHANRT